MDSTNMNNTNTSNGNEIHDPVREMFPMLNYPLLDALALDDDQWKSVYIPVIPNNLYLANPLNTASSNRFQAKYLKSFIENNLQIGSVKRIDFVDRSIENSDVPVKSAYIHFNHWFDSKNAKTLRYNLNTHGKHRQNGYFAADGMGSKFYSVLGDGSYGSGYFMFKINHKPIEEVDYEVNVPQLVATNRILEQKIKEKDAIFQRIKNILDVPGDDIRRQIMDLLVD